MQHNAQATCSICKSIPALCCCSCARLAARRCLAFVVTWEAEPPSAVLHAVDLCGRRCVACRFSAAAQANRARDRVTHPHTASFTLWIDRHQPTEPRWLAPSPLRDAHHAIAREPARVAAPAAGLTSDITVRGSLGASDFRINHEIRALDIPLQYM